jgi:GNAT superfamily N-acetyltransferase
MEGPRPPFEHELASFVTFLSNQLRPNVTWSIADEYPLAIDDSNLNNIRIIKDNENYLSAAVMKPQLMKSPAGIFKMAGIGSVVTNPSHRNQGLSRQVLEECLSAAQAHGCDFAVLWTNLYDFYRKIGFELAGHEVALTIQEPWPEETNHGLRFAHGANVEAEAILRLYSMHTAGSIRTAEDIRKYLKIPNSNVYTAWDDQGRMQAYAIEGKGMDLGGYVHEWGGGVSKLLPLLHHIRVSQNRPITVLSPKHASNLIRQLVTLGASTHEGILGMVRLLNVNNILLKMKKYTRAMGYEGVILEKRDGRIYLGYREKVYSTDSEADLIRLLFGPQKASHLYEFDEEVKVIFETLFPIPVWVWGWDSV